MLVFITILNLQLNVGRAFTVHATESIALVHLNDGTDLFIEKPRRMKCLDFDLRVYTQFIFHHDLNDLAGRLRTARGRA